MKFEFITFQVSNRELDQLRKDSDRCLRICSNEIYLLFQISEQTHSFLNKNIVGRLNYYKNCPFHDKIYSCERSHR